MRSVLVFGLTIVLCGCGVTPAIIKSDSLAFGDVFEDTTNKLLVVNVLRARDKAPLHFSDIPVIRESMQQTASLGFVEVMGSLSTTTRDTRAGTLSFQTSPSFELTHLQSKDFITGISSPIDPKIVKYWLDRGLDRRIVLLLFFSAAEIVETRSAKGPVRTIKIMNSPRDAIDVLRGRKHAFSGPAAMRCDTQADFERYLKLLNLARTFFANSFRERRLLAKGMNLDPEKDSKNLQNFAALDQSKVQLVYDKGLSAYTLYALSSEQKVAFCFYDDRTSPDLPSSQQYGVVQAGGEQVSDRRSCYQSVVDAPMEDSTKPQLSETPVFFRGPAEAKEESRFCEIYNRFARITPRTTDADGYPRLQVRLRIRSVGEIFQFLGDLLQYQDEVKNYLESEPRPKVALNVPITFGYCPDDPSPGCNDIFFRLDGDPGNARFSLTYRDRNYAVANINSQSSWAGNDQRKDHTIEILSVLHQLVNLNKSATDIRGTPSVQVLP